MIESYITIEEKLDIRRDHFALEEGYLSVSEEESPWIPFPGNDKVWIRHLSFDVRNNSAVNILRVDAGGSLGRHRHRGPVTGFTLEGSWYYEEYDWVAKPGDFIRESPGRTHTLMSDNGMKTLFHLNGAEEFLDDEDRILFIIDVYWFIDHYMSYCEEHNLPINQKLFL
ncbi:2,4'-dihydroxyacetophenone dioxygenase family protein [Niallia endozanthoxylica]|uniref:tRNA modification GTPase n=1 Tax=Niallia endozanthoxylica TaxID=2036016 RepID=A0A5J5HYH6_9BACI|nr:2,4'-dihydroxyacetophenone dioxygenase family protein [Niallia endozanthoxylica]KAA9027005.1 tRNA modification GTPase [Niallia endozanthoxylica]